jgi:hypothetical protein
VQDPFFRQDLFNKGNFFHSVPVENMETDHSLIYVIAPCCVELDLPYLQTEMKRKAAKVFFW